MKKIRCYLAGAFVPFGKYADWRDFIKEGLGDEMEFYDPRTDTRQGSIATFVYQDLVNGVDGSDVIFYFVINSGDEAVGAIVECARADAKNKLVVLCINKGIAVVHPVLFGISRRVFIGAEAGITYLHHLAEYGLENEFEAIYKTLKDS